MNVSFSTRGWQQIPWEQQVQMAETMRFGGVELYNVHKTPELTGRGGPLHRYTAAATARELWQKGLCIPCFDTACDIAGEDCTETVTALMQLAHDVQCPYVSVTAQRDDDARISAALEALLPAAEAQGITILLKTSGVFSDTARLRTLLDAGLTPVFSAIMHDGKGTLLNCNADSVASAVALGAAEIAPTDLVFCFEKAGVLRDPEDDTTLIREITAATYAPLKEDGTVNKGMIPKIENALKAIEKGVRSVTIKHSDNLLNDTGTVIRNS